MKKSIAILFACLFAGIVAAQRYNMGGGFRAGMANYVGDIGGKEKTAQPWLLDLKWQKTRWSLGAFFRHRIHPQVAYNVGLTYVRIEADDALSTNPARVGRNLNFKNDMLSIHGRIEWFPTFLRKADCGFNTRYRTAFETYLFGGVEALIHSPKTELNGTTYRLRDFQTEGEKYSPVAFGVPMGLGFQFVFARKHRIGLEIQWSWLATDYLDDISKNYVAHFDTPNPLPNNFILRLNKMLPKSIGVNQVKAIQPNIHARFDASTRTYKYFIHFNKDPFLQERSFWIHSYEFNFEKMNDAAKQLLLYKDFYTFEKKGSDNKTSLCDVQYAKWEIINNTKLKEWQKTGSDYAMHVADPEKKIIKPAGEWNPSNGFPFSTV